MIRKLIQSIAKLLSPNKRTDHTPQFKGYNAFHQDIKQNQELLPKFYSKDLHHITNIRFLTSQRKI